MKYLIVLTTLLVAGCAGHQDLKAPCSPTDGLTSYAPIQTTCGPTKPLDQQLPADLAALMSQTTASDDTPMAILATENSN